MSQGCRPGRVRATDCPIMKATTTPLFNLYVISLSFFYLLFATGCSKVLVFSGVSEIKTLTKHTLWHSSSLMSSIIYGEGGGTSRRPAKQTDCWELDALSPEVVDGLLDNKVLPNLLSDGENLVDDERETERYSAEDHLHVTYRQATARKFTMSGLKGDHIVYVRAVATCKGIAAAFYWVG